MKILFVLKHMNFVRHFAEVVATLADAGHEVCLACQDGETDAAKEFAGHPRITRVTAPRRRSDGLQDYVDLGRRARDYLRYLSPRYADACALRRRAFTKLIRGISLDSRPVEDSWSDAFLALNEGERLRLGRFFERLEATFPSDPGAEAFIEGHQPDIVLLTPVVDVGTSQADWVRAARCTGRPVGMLLFSWDNLSNKGLIHVVPDRVFVWNELQKREAVELHGVPPERVTVTGAPRFDPFFRMRPSLDYGAFCELLGLDEACPTILYVCSSRFVDARERDFVERWIAEIRVSNDERLGSCNVVIRPHPVLKGQWESVGQRVVRWKGPDGRKHKAVVAAPFVSERVVSVRSRLQNADQVLFECIHHSAAVVGLNTSAEIEAAVVGRPVFTILEPSRADGQSGTLHFHYLLKANGGPVCAATNFDAHRRQLGEALRGSLDTSAVGRFTESFLRPAGRNTPASAVLARAIEQMVPSPDDARTRAVTP